MTRGTSKQGLVVPAGGRGNKRRAWGVRLTASLLIGGFAATGGMRAVAQKLLSFQGAPPVIQLHTMTDEQIARNACSRCHMFVKPDMLTKQNWAEQILPRMAVELGVAKPDFSSSPEGDLIRRRGIYTTVPLVPVKWWPRIEHYYLSHAPDKPLPQPPHAPIQLGLPQFKVEPTRFRLPVPATTLVKISEKTHRIFVGDDGTHSLFILDEHGALLKQIPLGNTPTDVVETDRGLWVTCIGSLIPSEVYKAKVVFLPKKGDSYGPMKVIVDHLPRSVETRFADFNGDGRMDFAVCMFGNLTGRFSWFENLGNGHYREHILSEQTGAEYCEIHDFNGDGKPDIALLMAQNIEGLIMMMNDGHGNFTSRMVYERPPVYGHSYFEMDDFNGDGKLDFLVCNGDNGEYQSPLKWYHGLRILLNRGDNTFKQAFFYPLDGCYRAMARDFEGNGRLDIAAISYYPDYKHNPRESFVYLHNEGGFKYTVHTFPQCIAGRWITMDVGDLDGDGAPDIVLGSYINGPTAVPGFLMKSWQQYGPPILILHNTGHPAASPHPAHHTATGP